MHVLIVETGKHKGKRLKLPSGESLVGRDEVAGIRIASEEVSRTHCLIISNESGLRVRDLGSRNGTFVNGKPIVGEVTLSAGDLLVIGPMGFRLPAAESETRETPHRKPSKAESQKLSDDDIAGWLTIGAGDASSDGDTAVMEPPVGSDSKEIIVPAPKKSFRSTAEEAADIIRRHQESLQSGKP
jgi:pSer/pThr/pTyr-binding forkhead associated (FHA) protein